VKNDGNFAGDEVVEMYLTQPKAALTPVRTLAGFTRVHIEAGQTTHVALRIDPRVMGQVDEKGKRVILEGAYSVVIGGAQPEETTSSVRGNFGVIDTKELPR
jgi:beta-glucosidase